MRRKGFRVTVVALSVMAIVAMATSTAAVAKGLGPKDKATGATITVGFMSDGQSASVDTTDETPTVEAAERYINEYLGGIGKDGLKLEVDVCENHSTPAGTTDCINHWIAEGVPVVINGTTGQGGTLASGLTAAGIIQFYSGTIELGALRAANSFVMSNGLAIAFGVEASHAQEKGYERVTQFTIDLPGGRDSAQAIGVPIYEAAGATLEVVAIPPGTPDMTPQVQAALETDPQQVVVVGDPTFCIGTLKALDTLGYDGSILVIPTCVDPTVIDAVPGGLKGVVVGTSSTTKPNDPDIRLKAAVLKKFAPDLDPASSFTQQSWISVMGFALAMEGFEGDVSPESVNAAIKAMAPQPLPLGGGLEFQCNGEQVSLAPAICTPGALLVTLGKNGREVKVEAVDTTELLAALG